MKKTFNVTGSCSPAVHYMMDTTQHVAGMYAMIERGDYFTINRPRQYGKTTILHALEQFLLKQKGYLPLVLSFEDVGDLLFVDEAKLSQNFFDLLLAVSYEVNPQVAAVLQEQSRPVPYLKSLSAIITTWVRQIDYKLVLLIDEVDAESRNPIFLRFLGLLRNKYLNRFRSGEGTFHSVILAGVHDIKNLKINVREGALAQLNSPWNIAATFKVRMHFVAAEIEPMLLAYSQEEGIPMDVPTIAACLYYYTAGYPFLVSKLCKVIAEELLPQKTTPNWTKVDVEQAVQLLLKENNTNFDSLIKNLENNTNLYNLVYRIIVKGQVISFNQYNPVIYQGILYGIFKSNGRIRIHNRIYEQLIYEYMVSKTLTDINELENYSGHFLLDNQVLDMKAVLLKFQQFMKEQYSHKQKGFIEHHGRVLFLAFLAPILNGEGYSFKEVQTSLEKRLDVVVTYHQHRYIIELKRWYGPKAHEKGLAQLADYLAIHDLPKGYLLIFDDRKEKQWAAQSISHQGKDIFAVWV